MGSLALSQPAHHRRRADLVRLRSLRRHNAPGRDPHPAAGSTPYGLLLQILDKARRHHLRDERADTAAVPGARPDRRRAGASRRAARQKRCAPPRGPSTSTTPTWSPWPSRGVPGLVRGPQSWTVASVGSKTAAITAGGVPILTFAGLAGRRYRQRRAVAVRRACPTPRSPGSGRGATARAISPTRSSPAGSSPAPSTRNSNDRVYAFFDRYVKGDAPPQRHPRAALLHAERGHLATTTRGRSPRTWIRLALLRRRAHADLAARRRPAGLGPATPQPDSGHGS